MEAHIFGLEPGTHAIHLHEKADCSSSDGKSTGGHWNPTFEQHGAWENDLVFTGVIWYFEADDKGHGWLNFQQIYGVLAVKIPLRISLAKL